MKFSHIVPSLEERYGGPSKSTLSLAVALARAGNSVELLATDKDPSPPKKIGQLEVLTFKRGSPARLCPSTGLRDHLRKSDPSVVHHHALWLRTLHYAYTCAKSKKAAFVVSPRGMMGHWAWRHHRGRKRLAGAFVHPGALSGADGWHATSQEEADSIRSLGFKQPICVAPNGISQPDLELTLAAAEHWRAICPEVAERPVALFYSRFHRKKRVLELIDLWATMPASKWLLLIVGIPQEYTVADLEDYAHRTSAGRVRVFSGLGQPPPYPVASLFLLPSHNENFGLSIAEALAHGVPALVTDATPWSPLNSNGGGWCVPWGEYANALKWAAGEGEGALRERGAKAKNWVLREYSWEKPAQALIEFYRQLGAT